jgi:hypothetical protein
MLLTPEHFLRQERYHDSTLLWLQRYYMREYGLIGAGGRAEPTERGAAAYDPVIDVQDEGEVVKVSVRQCRGLTRSGDRIEIAPSQAVHQSFPTQELAGHSELGIYVVCTPHDKVVDDALEDPANPQMPAARRPRYQVQLGVTAAEAPHSLLLGRMRKSDQSLRYEKLNGVIPLGMTMDSHSELARAWKQLTAYMGQLTDRYITLHKAIYEYIHLASQRDVHTRQDEETLRFVGRMVETLKQCTQATQDPGQSPQRFFQHLHGTIQSTAVYFDLSPPTREYFWQLAQVGETEFATLVEQEQRTLLPCREFTIHDDLRMDVQRAENAFRQLCRLEEALEGKYVDFRVSPVLEALNFFFDRRSDLFYHSIVQSPRPQVFDEELTFVFAPLRLEGQQKYRLILVSKPEARFAAGDSLRAEIRFNVGAGQPLGPVYGTAHCDIPGQRNFAIDVDAPAEVSTITDLRITMNATWPIQSCLLYVRRFLYPGTTRIRPEEPQPAPALPPQSAPAPGPRRRLVR